MEQIRIVCFGDSNTWGYDPRTSERFPQKVRWTGLLQEKLGRKYQVIEEGQNGRTIATEDPCEGEKNGLNMIVPCMESQKPFDLLILMLGTNDFKGKFGYCAMDVAGEMERMLEKIRIYGKYHMTKEPRILLVSPVHVGETIRESWLGECFGYEHAVRVSRELAEWYAHLAKTYGCDFMDASEFAKVGGTDAIHLEKEGHAALAGAMECYVRRIFEV